MDHPKRSPEEKAARRADTMRVVKALDARRPKRTKARPAKRPKLNKRPLCGAKCRDGHACGARAVWLPGARSPRNGRCAVHGGLSTGARTPEGKARVLAAIRASREARRASAATSTGHSHAAQPHTFSREAKRP